MLGRKSGTASLLVVAALLLGGCHWGYAEVTPFQSDFVVNRQSTTETILRCTAAHPNDSTARAECALDVVWLGCNVDPLPNLGLGECRYATDHRYVPDMKASIQEIIKHDRDVSGHTKVCLYYEDPLYVGIDAWYSVSTSFPHCN